jgi:protoheme IX farnesyltransferase
MNVKSIAGQLGERQARFALSTDSVGPLVDRWSVSDFVALTKPRVMIVCTENLSSGVVVVKSAKDGV